MSSITSNIAERNLQSSMNQAANALAGKEAQSANDPQNSFDPQMLLAQLPRLAVLHEAINQLPVVGLNQNVAGSNIYADGGIMGDGSAAFTNFTSVVLLAMEIAVEVVTAINQVASSQEKLAEKARDAQLALNVALLVMARLQAGYMDSQQKAAAKNGDGEDINVPFDQYLKEHKYQDLLDELNSANSQSEYNKILAQLPLGLQEIVFLEQAQSYYSDPDDSSECANSYDSIANGFIGQLISDFTDNNGLPFKSNNPLDWPSELSGMVHDYIMSSDADYFKSGGVDNILAQDSANLEAILNGTYVLPSSREHNYPIPNPRDLIRNALKRVMSGQNTGDDPIATYLANNVDSESLLPYSGLIIPDMPGVSALFGAYLTKITDGNGASYYVVKSEDDIRAIIQVVSNELDSLGGTSSGLYDSFKDSADNSGSIGSLLTVLADKNKYITQINTSNSQTLSADNNASDQVQQIFNSIISALGQLTAKFR